MAKLKSQDELPKQLPLPDFIEQLNSNLGARLKHRVTQEDIGGQLLSIISKGLYSNPLDFIREYVQNAVDGQASVVDIKITGKSVTIVDDGIGMTIEDLNNARKVGYSTKSLWYSVGFRGIGIYSSYDVCNRLIIESKQDGEDTMNILEFDFKAMRDELELGQQSSLEQGIHLTELITNHSEYSKEALPPEFIDWHGTRVVLQEVNDAHYREIVTDTKRLKEYMLFNLPIDFTDDFEHKDEINRLLSTHTESYNPIIINLEIEGQPLKVERPAIPNLTPPQGDYINNSNDEPIAYYWACLHKPGGTIKGFDDYRGFTYKIRGFSIGDNKRLMKHVGRTGAGTLYNWYFGEVFVLDKNVMPNAARDDFEPSDEKISLESHVGKTLKKLRDRAEDHRDQINANKVIDNAKSELKEYNKKLESYNQNELPRLIQEIGNLADEVRKKVDNASDRNDARSVLKQVESLEKRIHNLIDSGIQSVTLPLISDELIDDFDSEENLQEESEELDIMDSNGQIAPLPNDLHFDDQSSKDDLESDNEIDTMSIHVSTLMSVISEAGYDLDDDTQFIVELIDLALSEIIGYESPAYVEFLEEFSRQLTD